MNVISREVFREKQNEARTIANSIFAGDNVLALIAAESSLDTIIDIIDRHPERDINLPVDGRGGSYMLDKMLVYKRILKSGGEYRGYRFDLYEYDSDTPLTWVQAQHLIGDGDYKGYPMFLLRLHDGTGRVNVEWPIPFTMLAGTSTKPAPVASASMRPAW